MLTDLIVRGRSGKSCPDTGASMVFVRVISGCLILLASAPVSADEDQVRRHASRRTDRPPKIDGDLSDPAWRRAEPTGDLTQAFPDPGKPASFPTEIRVLHDDEALYVAAHCHDPEPPKIVARVTRRDRWIESEWFHVSIDSRHDRRTGFFFGVNAAGVKLDGTLFDENQSSTDWDGVWEAATRIVRDGWDVEMRIPLELLRFRAGQDVRFGIQFARRISRLTEANQWQHIPPDSGLHVSRYGELTGLDLRHRPLHLELAPYAAARPNIQADGSAGARPFDVGADARLGLGSNFMLTVTANPDFGQVEIDQVVLNLSTIETYYPEKRPFFLEDMSIFQTPNLGGYTQAQLFYSRRIGRAPRMPDTEEEEEIIRRPRLPRIYGAAKIAGMTEGRFSIGLLQAVTSGEDALLRGAGDVEYSRMAEPLTSFSILRARQDFWRHSSAGLMATSMVTPDHGAAFTGGADLQMELFDDKYKLGVLSFFSCLTEDRYPWQDDFTKAALEEEGAFGYGGQLSFAKTGGDHLVGSAYALYYSPSLALDDVGYLDRADRLFVSGSLRHHRLKPLGPLARYVVQATGWVDRNSDMGNLGDGFSIDAWMDFLNGWSGGAWFFCAWPLCDDRETRSAGKVSLCGEAQRYRSGLWMFTNEKYPVSAGLDLGWNITERGQGTNIWATVKLNPHPRLQLEIMPGYSYSTGSVRWIHTEETALGDRYLFADRHTEYWDVTFRTTFTFTTEINLQANAQLFLASVDHTRKYAPASAAGSNIHVSDLVGVDNVADDYDFTSSNLNISAVLRWEYLPGSIAYLVYTGAFGDLREVPEFRFGNVLTDLPGGEAQHVLLLKISYLWG